MGRELAEGPDAVLGTLAEVERLRSALSAAVGAADRIVLVGTGGSLAAIRTAAALWRRRLGDAESTRAAPVAGVAAHGRRGGVGPPGELIVRESAEAVLGDLDGRRFAPSDLVIAVSQSGTSPETVAAARTATAAGSHLLAITAHPGSPLGVGASVVLRLASGEETDASTKSALATLAGLLAIAGVVPSEPVAAAAIADRLSGIVADVEPTARGATVLGRANRTWCLGFGPALGLAEAGALLWHEKVVRPAIAATPSAFRHGLIEAVAGGDAVVLIEIDEADPGRDGYLGRLRAELAELDIALIEIAPADAGGGTGVRALEALLRLQLLARATALGAGTYRDGFVILRRVVTAATELVD